MANDTEYNKVINKLIGIEDKISDIDKIAKTLDIWVKENSYELIPMMNMLNNKINDVIGIIKK